MVSKILYTPLSVGLGIGAGWMAEEFELMGQPFARRGKRMDEMVEVVRTLWRGGMVEHHGDAYEFPRLQMSPAPSVSTVWTGKAGVS